MSAPTDKPAAPPAHKPTAPAELVQKKHDEAAKSSAGSGKKPTLSWIHAGAVALVVISLVLPIYLVVESESVRAAGAGGFVAVFFAVLAALLALVRVVTMKKHPRALGIAALASTLGAAALLFAALGARLARASAESMAASDVAHEAGMREYLVAQADAGARTAALLGLAGIPGFLGGLFLVVHVLGARRLGESDPKTKGDGLKTSRVWLALVGSIALFVGAAVLDVIAIAHPVREAVHPHAAKLDAIAEAKKRGDMTAACDGLEVALAPDYAPEKLFEEHLPGRLELAHRCVTHRIDALPKSECSVAAKTLSQTETVRLAKAEERVAAACEAK